MPGTVVKVIGLGIAVVEAAAAVVVSSVHNHVHCFCFIARRNTNGLIAAVANAWRNVLLVDVSQVLSNTMDSLIQRRMPSGRLRIQGRHSRRPQHHSHWVPAR